MKKITKILMFTLTALTVCSCYKTPDLDSLSYDLVVATDVDIQANFNDYETYYISDTIPVITTVLEDSILVGEAALSIVNKIKENMTLRGYRFVERDENPNLGLIPSIIRIDNVQGVCSGWWGGYPGYWDPPYWGYPGYGYYYPYCSYYKYETGSLNLEIFDLKIGVSNIITAVWGSTMFGVLSKSDSTNLDRALKAIDQAFEQSPYLDRLIATPHN